MSSGVANVTTSATEIVPARKGANKRAFVLLYNAGSVDVTISDLSTIVAAQAPPLSSGDYMRISSGYEGAIYGITATSSANVLWWETF